MRPTWQERIEGELLGAAVGSGGIPDEWSNTIAEWPLTVAVHHRLACELSAPLGAGKSVSYFWPGILPRNLFFLVGVEDIWQAQALRHNGRHGLFRQRGAHRLLLTAQPGHFHRASQYDE